MTTETGLTIITPKSLTEAKELATTLAAARTIPEALQKSPADVMAIVMAGAELGLAPMQAIRALVLIKGKPTLSADAMGALVKSRRDVCQYLVLKHSDATRATFETQRIGDPSPTTISFTVDEAKTAGLNGDNWRKFPAAMLRARALSAICRAVYPDLLLGVYDPDELAPEPAARMVDVTPAATPPKAHRMPIHDVEAPKASPPPAASAEDARIEDALEKATTLDALNALVPALGALKGRSPAYDRLRARWGVRRDELRAAYIDTVQPAEPGSES